MKKVVSFLLAMSMAVSICTSNVFAGSNWEDGTGENPVVETAGGIQELEFVGEKDGVKTYRATIPVTWHSDDGAVTYDISDCNFVANYHGNGVWTCSVSYTALDQLTEITANISTYGVAGSTSRTVTHGTPDGYGYIGVRTELNHLFPTSTGWQFFKVSGIVKGMHGNGSFGPHIKKVYVEAE